MAIARNKYYLLNYVFIICILLLFINDHYLKYVFANWFTGKLSDMLGIIILPLLLSFIFPALQTKSIFWSAIFFCFWKSSFSEGFIDFYNDHAFIKISRVIDYSDLMVLVFLPVPYYLIRHIDTLPVIKVSSVRPVFILIPAVFILMATSVPPDYYYTRSDGNLKCYHCDFSTGLSQDEIIGKLQKRDIKFNEATNVDSFALRSVAHFKDEKIKFYRVNELIIEGDTLRDLDFTLRTKKNNKTIVYFTGMNVPQDLSDEKLEKKLRKYYRKLIVNELKLQLKK